MDLSTGLWLLLVTLGLVQITNFCTTIYLHRAVTHQALKLHPVVAFLMHLELFLATGVAPREWAAVHRKHHRFSDREGDPHSPYLEGLWKVLFLNFLLYREELRNPETVRRYTPNWKGDLIDRIPYPGIVGPALGITLLGVAFGFLPGVGFWGGAGAAVGVWFLHVAIYIFLNAMINSVCHKIGYRNFNNTATNLQWVAWITAGEGLHNNHHESPASARLQALKGEIDPAWPVIRLLAALRLAQYEGRAVASAFTD